MNYKLRQTVFHKQKLSRYNLFKWAYRTINKNTQQEDIIEDIIIWSGKRELKRKKLYYEGK